jgi:hypothetical protein
LKGAILMGGLDVVRRLVVAVGRWAVSAGCVALAVAVVTGCATLSADTPNEQKQALTAEQATARWQLVIDGNAGAAYDKYMSEGSRQVVSRNEFVATMKRTAFRSAKVESVECAGEACTASVRLTYDHELKKGVGITVVEHWIIEDRRLRYVWSK